MSAIDEQGKEVLSEEGKATKTPDISKMMDGILANPELIGMVASAIGPMLKNQSEAKVGTETASAKSEGEQGDSVEASAEPAFQDMASTIAPLLSLMQKSGAQSQSKTSDRRSCLLLALKPYLCAERCEAIDYMLKLARFSEIFKTLT